VVTLENRLLQNIALVLCVVVATMSNASAAVRAEVDRPSVDLNESFMLEIIVDSNTDMEPDLTVLEPGFYVGQVSQLIDIQRRDSAQPYMDGCADAEEHGRARNSIDYRGYRAKYSGEDRRQ
jgi:hypothetical protein